MVNKIALATKMKGQLIKQAAPSKSPIHSLTLLMPGKIIKPHAKSKPPNAPKLPPTEMFG